MNNNQLVTKNQELPTTQTTDEIVSQGSERAKQLMVIVNQNQWAKNIQGKNYLQVEAWQTLGRFYGYTAKTKSTEYVEMGNVKGFNATVEILDKDGNVVGGAEAGCYTDEKRWATAQLYSLKSMAQTRATGKAYRQILSWVAVLAGYEPTPAEEMEGIVVEPPVETPATNNTSPYSSSSRIKYLYKLWHEQNLDVKVENAKLCKKYGLMGLYAIDAKDLEEEIRLNETGVSVFASKEKTVAYKYATPRVITRNEINKNFNEQIEMEETN